MRNLANKNYIKHLVVLPLFLSLISSHQTLDRQLSIRYLLFSLILLLFSFILLKGKINHRHSISRLTKFFFLIFISFILFNGISLIYTINISDGLFLFTKLLLIGIYIALIFLVFNDPENLIDYFSKTITILGLIVCLFGLSEFFQFLINGINNSTLYDITATFGNKNVFAQYIFFILPFSLFLTVSGSKGWKMIAGIISSIIIIFIVLLMTRSVWVAFLGSITFISVLSFMFKVVHRKKMIAFLAVVFIATVLSVTVYSLFDNSNTFFHQITGYGTEKGRLVLWQNTLEIFKEAPITGKGLGSWKIEILQHLNHQLLSEENKVFYQRPHNDFLWILTEVGVFGLAAYVSMFILGLYFCLQLLDMNIQLKIKYYILALMFALFGFLFVSIFSFPLERMEHIIYVAFVFGSVIALFNHYHQSDKHTLTFKPTVSLIIFSLITLSSIFVGVKRYYGELYLKKAFSHRQNKNWRMVISNIENADSFFYRVDMLSTPLKWYEGLAYFNMKKFEEAYRCFEEAYAYNPYHIYVLNDLATSSSTIGKHEEAILFYKEILKIVPDFEDALYNICTIYHQQNKQDSALYYFSKIENANTSKYDKYLRVLVKPKIEKLLNSSLAPHLRNALIKYSKSPDNLKRSVKNAGIYNNKLEEQLLRDVRTVEN